MNDPCPRIDLDVLLAHAGWVRALARTLVRDEHIAEDVVQQTWIAALRRGDAGRRSLRPWLAAITRHLALNWRRSENRRRKREPLALPQGPALAPQQILDLETSRQRVVMAVMALEDPYRTTVLLRFFHGWSPSEIARQQRVPAATVRTRLKRALDQLRGRLTAEEREANHAALILLSAAPPSANGVVSIAAGLLEKALLMSTNTKIFAVACLAMLLGAAALVTLGWRYARQDPAARSGPHEGAPAVASAASPEGSSPLDREPALPRPSAGDHEQEPDRIVWAGSTSVHGRVVDEAGAPISGAAVEMAFALGEPVTAVKHQIRDEYHAYGVAMKPRLRVFRSVTGDDGTYAITRIRNDVPFAMIFSAPGFCGSRWDAPPVCRSWSDTLPPRDQVGMPDVVLRRGNPVLVRAVDERHVAVHGARVFSDARSTQPGPTSGSQRRIRPSCWQDQGVTGGDGKLSFTPKQVGPQWVLGSTSLPGAWAMPMSARRSRCPPRDCAN